MPSDDGKGLRSGLAFAVFLTVIVLIALVLIAQRIPRAQRPALHPAISTVVITQVPTPHR